MGARISFTNHIHISDESFENGVMKGLGYNDISSEMLEEIAHDKRSLNHLPYCGVAILISPN